MRFIYCYDDKAKEKLLSQGYTFIKNIKYKNRNSYLFINDGQADNNLSFSNEEIEYSNKLCF